jgi:hypothetical protein
MNLNGKGVLVTVPGGFICSHLAETMVGHVCSERAFILYNSRNHRGWLENSLLSDEMEVRRALYDGAD